MTHSARTPVKALVALALFTLTGGLTAQKAKAADASFDLAAASAYVWRGITVTDGAVLQPSMTVSKGGFSANLWGNFDIDDFNQLDYEFNEIDLTASYGWSTDKVSFELGFIEYLFPNGFGLGTREVYFSLGVDATVSPTFSFYYDFDEVESFYSTIGLEYGNPVGSSGAWSYTLSALGSFVGDKFARFYVGGTDSGAFAGELGLSFDYQRNNVGMSIFAAYTDSLDDKVLPDQLVNLYGGIAVSVSF